MNKRRFAAADFLVRRLQTLLMTHCSEMGNTMSDMARKIQIRYVKSAIGAKQPQRRTLRALGLKRLQSTVVHTVSPQIEGMVYAVRHLVEVTEVSD